MTNTAPPQAPPFCPRQDCPFHKGNTKAWRYIRKGTFPSRRTGASTQRLGRHAMLLHQRFSSSRPIDEPVALDSFVSFVYSQYHPTHFHVIAGRSSHFFYGFTENECRRRGTMTRRQKARRKKLEARLERPRHRRPGSLSRNGRSGSSFGGACSRAGSRCPSAGSSTSRARRRPAPSVRVQFISSGMPIDELTGPSSDIKRHRAQSAEHKGVHQRARGRGDGASHTASCAKP